MVIKNGPLSILLVTDYLGSGGAERQLVSLAIGFAKRGHDVTVVPPFKISGCATAVMLDPATGNKIAAADPRRDCYAVAY